MNRKGRFAKGLRGGNAACIPASLASTLRLTIPALRSRPMLAIRLLLFALLSIGGPVHALTVAEVTAIHDALNEP